MAVPTGGLDKTRLIYGAWPQRVMAGLVRAIQAIFLTG